MSDVADDIQYIYELFLDSTLSSEQLKKIYDQMKSFHLKLKQRNQTVIEIFSEILRNKNKSEIASEIVKYIMFDIPKATIYLGNLCLEAVENGSVKNIECFFRNNVYSCRKDTYVNYFLEIFDFIDTFLEMYIEDSSLRKQIFIEVARKLPGKLIRLGRPSPWMTQKVSQHQPFRKAIYSRYKKYGFISANEFQDMIPKESPLPFSLPQNNFNGFQNVFLGIENNFPKTKNEEKYTDIDEMNEINEDTKNFDIDQIKFDVETETPPLPDLPNWNPIPPPTDNNCQRCKEFEDKIAILKKWEELLDRKTVYLNQFDEERQQLKQENNFLRQQQVENQTKFNIQLYQLKTENNILQNQLTIYQQRLNNLELNKNEMEPHNNFIEINPQNWFEDINMQQFH